MGLFSSGSSKVKYPAWVHAGGNYIADLLKQPDPDFPLQDIIGFTPVQELAQRGLEQFMERPGVTEDMQLGLTGLRGVAEGRNVMDTYEPLLSEIEKRGKLETNRLGRMLQTGGALTSTPGRDVLGRSEMENRQSMLAAMAPYMEAEKDRQFQSFGLLPAASEYINQEPLRKAQTGFTLGSVQQSLQQRQADARYNKLMQQIEFPYQTKGPLATGAVQAGAQYGTVSGGDPSIFSQLAPMIGMMALSGGLGGLGGLFGGGTASTAGAAGTNAFAAFPSDMRLKKDIVPLSGALDILEKIPAKRFTFDLEGADPRDAGVLAQDVERVMPEAVREIEGVKFIKIDAMFGLLVGAVNELREEVRSIGEHK